MSKMCPICGRTYPEASGAFWKSKATPDGFSRRCKACPPPSWTPLGTKGFRARKAAPMAVSAAPAATEARPPARIPTYVASKELLALWAAVLASADGTVHPVPLLFTGPSGSGKTVGAQYLAAVAGLPFTKVDAAAMTDPESWFGTREIVAHDGVAVTVYRPSEFVTAITQPGVVLVDEINRVRDEHRNIFLPLLDGTNQVTNPLTGETVVKHPRCFVVMSGNKGLHFTGTYPIDPALTSRSVHWKFDYVNMDDEVRIVVDQSGVDPEVARLFVRFANETRLRASEDFEMLPVSTREVIAASRLVAKGLSVDVAAKAAFMNGASDEGGAASVEARLRAIWVGIRKIESQDDSI